MTEGKKVLCVCFGNTCRSPMMEVILRSLAAGNNIPIHVESAGTSPDIIRKSEGAAPEAIAQMNEWAIGDLSAHRARHIEQVDLTSFDRILVVDEKTKAAVIAAGAPAGPVKIVNEAGGGVPNPWQQGSLAYKHCALLLRRTLNMIAIAL